MSPSQLSRSVALSVPGSALWVVGRAALLARERAVVVRYPRPFRFRTPGNEKEISVL